MRQLIAKLVIPLTIISFLLVTKWWYGMIVDGPDVIFVGFPLIFTGPGLHTSLSKQFFVLEFVVDALTYFSFWMAIVYVGRKIAARIITVRIIRIFINITTVVVLCFAALFYVAGENAFHWKRPFDIEVYRTGYKFTWTYQNQSDYIKYLPKTN